MVPKPIAMDLITDRISPKENGRRNRALQSDFSKASRTIHGGSESESDSDGGITSTIRRMYPDFPNSSCISISLIKSGHLGPSSSSSSSSSGCLTTNCSVGSFSFAALQTLELLPLRGRSGSRKTYVCLCLPASFNPRDNERIEADKVLSTQDAL